MNPENAKEVGRVLRQRRHQLELSTPQLAALSGVDQATIVRYERGSIARPGAETLAKVATALDLPLGDVFGRAGFRPPTDLPSFRPYLRAKYSEMPAEDLDAIEKYAIRLAKKHGINLDGPAPGEDEEP